MVGARNFFHFNPLDAGVVLTCGCSACAAANQSGEFRKDFLPGAMRDAATLAAAAVHVSTGATGGTTGTGSDSRSYALLTQTQNSDGSWSFSGDRNIDAVLIGSKIASTQLTFAFPTSGDGYGNNYDFGQADQLLPFNELQQAAARDAFRLVAGYTNLTFRELTPAEALEERPTFRLAQTTLPAVQSAMGNFPHSADSPLGQNPSGDIWFGRSGQPYYTNPEKGNWGYVTVLHEIGHTLGLKHGGDDYTGFDVGVLFGSEQPLYGTRALEYDKDGQAWSLMTYTVAPDTFNAFNGDGVNNAQSFMQYDIAALQYLYGANSNTESGDTVYRWSEKTGEKFVNGVGQGAPAGNKVLETIWDGGGNDTYDLSNYANGVSVDLRPGGFLTLSQEQLANAEGYYDGFAPMNGSVGNALLYQGDLRSLIENAIGGAGNDRMIGNQVDNVLVGGAGDDFLDGMEGSDILDGGAGSDTASFSSASSGIAVTLNNGTGDIRVVNGNDVDVLRSIENIAGTRFDDRLVGDDGDNMLAGGAGGNDVLIGGAGNDRLVGGGYQLAHLDKPDIVKDGGWFNGTLDTALAIDDGFDLAARFGVADATTIPHATVLATVAADGFEYYSFTGKAGASVTIDIDEIDAYMTLQLFDAGGMLVGRNFEALRTDEGSRLASDPKLSLILPADGVYYIAVSDRAGNAGFYRPTDMPWGATYTMHVSLEGATVAAPTLVSTATATMDGGVGDDMLVASVGDDVIIGGAGNDTVSYEQAYRGVTVNLGSTARQDTGAGRDAISGVENIIGSRHDDMLIGDAGANVIDGGGGSDSLYGGAGVDTLSFASQSKAVSVDLSRQGQRQVTRLGETLVATGFENVTGTALADTITGDRNANILDGGAGDDMLIGDAGGDTGGGVDQFIGGAGSDTVSFAPYRDAIAATLTAGGAGSASANGRLIATFREIENLVGGSGDDRLTGNDAANVLTGGLGNDTIDGGRGNDTIDGGSGDDVLTGGAGIDTLVYSGTGALRLDLRRTDVQNTGFGLDRISGFENVRMNTSSSVVFGDAGNNVFHDGGGDDTIDGGGGVDTVDYSAARGRVTVSLEAIGVQDTGAAGFDTLTGIERLIGGNFGNFFTGSDAANRLVGGTGDDIIVGGRGADVILGGDGDDILVGDRADLTDLDDPDAGDVIDGGQGADFIIGGRGNDILRGGSGNDSIIGGSIGFVFYPDGTYDLNNGLFLDGGNDIIDGGDGIDAVRLQFGGRNEDVAIDLTDSAAINVLYSDGVAVGSVTNVERSMLIGGNGNDRFVGTAGDDDLRGEDGDDTLIGGLGDDFLYGGHGDDFIDGGEGHDIADYGFGATSGVTIDLRITGPQDTGGWGVDTIRNIEEIYTSIFSDTIIGGDENLTVSDDRGGDDSFYGNGGSDDLEVVRYPSNEGVSTIILDGGAGNDRLRYGGGLRPGPWTEEEYLGLRDTVTLIGGSGDDFIESVGALSSTIDAGDGNDVVAISIAGSSARAAYDIRLGAGIDELAIQWAGSDAANFTRDEIIVRDFMGGEGGDLLGLTGLINSALDTYIGETNPFMAGYIALVKDGSDTLLQVDKDGRFGPAAMTTVMRLQGTNAFTLGFGNVYAYLLDEVTLDSSVVIYDPIVTQYMKAGQSSMAGHEGRDDLQGSARADTLYGRGGDDVLNGHDGNDTLYGGAGNDYLIGGAGNDRLDGNTGADTMLGGTGDDTYVVDNVNDVVGELAGEGNDTVISTIDYTLGWEVENLYLAQGARIGTGNALDNRLFGTGGDDTFYGMDGNDWIKGWAGNDTLYGGAGDDRLEGAEGNDWLDGGTGADYLEGGIGNDTYIVDNIGDRVVEWNANGSGGVDSVYASIDYTLGNNVENLFLTGNAVSGTGNALNNVLRGNAQGNVLRGGAGNDTLIGMAGDDTLYGGAGADKFVFSAGSGRDIVADFGRGDTIDLSGYPLDGAPVVIDLGGDVLVDLGSGDTILLLDITPEQLSFMGSSFGFTG